MRTTTGKVGLDRRQIEIDTKEAELNKIHNLLPLQVYRAIRNPIKKLLRRQLP